MYQSIIRRLYPKCPTNGKRVSFTLEQEISSSTHFCEPDKVLEGFAYISACVRPLCFLGTQFFRCRDPSELGQNITRTPQQPLLDVTSLRRCTSIERVSVQFQGPWGKECAHTFYVPYQLEEKMTFPEYSSSIHLPHSILNLRGRNSAGTLPETNNL